MRTRGGLLLNLAVVALLLLVVGGGYFAWKTWTFYQEPLAAIEASSREELGELGFERVEADLPHGRLVAFEAGAGRPLVFVHGAGHQAGVWGPVASRFVDRHRVVLVDLPGHGGSEPSEGPIPAEALYGNFEAFIDRYRDEEPILIGNSLGAFLSMVYAHRHPDALERVVALNGGALASDLNGHSLLPTTREEARALVSALRDADSPPVPDFVLDDLVEHGPSSPVARVSADFEGLQALVLDGKLGELRAPVDILWGTSDQLMDLGYAERMRDELPVARLVTIPRCGHIPHTECPEPFYDRLSALLSEPAPALPPAEKEPAGEPEAPVLGEEGPA